ncbi:MAG: methylmalonyl-CoA mutase small subunit, partial [Muribaculaceae bacterium]|nr:methylmalonyl-CoA mutase small subunit [Muribaculaceae bacterium]
MAEKKEKLFDQFPEVSTQEWRAKVDADLKGAPFEKKLVWRTNEGFNVQPMYRAEDIADFKTTESLPGEYPFLRGIKDNNNWLTRQNIIADTPAEANAIALDILTKGVTSLGFKVTDPSVETISTLLKEIDIAQVEINFDCCQGKVVALTEALVEYLVNNELAQVFKGSINYNPLKRTFKHGSPVSSEIVDRAKHIIELVAPVPQLRVLAINSEEFNAAGAYIFQELGFALAWG